MKIEESVIRKYLHDMAADQLSMEYTAKGWVVSRNEKIDNIDIDLIARKNDAAVVFEIKVDKYSQEQRRNAARLNNLANDHGYEFRLVLVNPFKERSIEVIGLDGLFYTYFSEEFPIELDVLSGATTLNDVYDCDVDDITVNEGGSIIVKGNGRISVNLSYGPANDAAVSRDSFPFFFEASLSMAEGKLIIEEITSAQVDTSSFYE